MIPDLQSQIDNYAAYLSGIFQANADSFIEGISDDLPAVSTWIYNNIPDQGMITGVTYGLSFSDHPTWMYGKPELMITVQSESIEWARAAANMAFQLRGSCPFAYGNTIRYGKPIAHDSNMDAFFIFAPSILNKEDYLHIDLGLDYKICIAGLYPIYSSEIELINTWGLKDFWHHPEFDMYDVKRKPITG